MSNSSHQSVSEAARATAADWLVRLHRAATPDWADPDLLHWLEQDDQHRVAFADASELWFAGAELGDTMNEVPEADDEALPQVPDWQRPTRLGFPRVPGLLVSALFVIAIWWFSPVLLQQYRDIRFDLVGPSSGLVQVTLEDGTAVGLAPGAILERQFNDDQRLVVLRQGPAYFDVTRNPDRPFRVDFVGGKVEVLGTAFGVEISDDGAQVGVLRGRVRVANGNESALLSAGDARRIDATGITVSEESPEQMFDWFDGMLRFEGVPFEQAIEQMQSFQSQRLMVLADLSPSMRVTASIDLERLDEGMETLAGQVGLSVSRLPGLTLIH